MQISFGNKIPISKTQVFNDKKQKFEEAVLYEYDGKNRSDVDELTEHTGDWEYKYRIAAELLTKYNKLAFDTGMSDFSRYVLENNKFYVLETKDKELAAICETHGYCNTADIHYLERNPNGNYKLAGQAILASIAKHMLTKPEAHFIVNDPVDSARSFYTETCGFEEETPGSHSLMMDEAGMTKLVDNFEEAVQPPPPPPPEIRQNMLGLLMLTSGFIIVTFNRENLINYRDVALCRR